MDLIQFTARISTKPCAGSAQIVWCKGRNTNLQSGRPYDVPNGLFANPVPERATRSADTAKNLSTINASRTEPAKQFPIYPIGHRDRAKMTALAHKIDNGPMVFSLLHVFDSQIRGLVSPQSAGQEKSQQGTVTFAFHARVVRTLPQRASLLIRQPVSHPHAILLQALHAPDPCGQIGTEQTAICCLVGQPPNGAQPKVDRPGSQSPGFQVTSIPKHHNAIECKPGLRAVPIHKFVGRVPVSSLRFRAAQAVHRCRSGVFEIEESQNSLWTTGPAISPLLQGWWPPLPTSHKMGQPPWEAKCPGCRPTRHNSGKWPQMSASP